MATATWQVASRDARRFREAPLGLLEVALRLRPLAGAGLSALKRDQGGPAFRSDSPPWYNGSKEGWMRSIHDPGLPHTVRLGDRRRLVLPAEICARLRLAPGDELVATIDESGRIVLASLRAQVERQMGADRDLVRRGERLSDELIRDRRREGRRK